VNAATPTPAPVPTPSPAPMSPGDEAPAGTPGSGEAICPRCGGSGQWMGRECLYCGGRGKVNKGIGGG
jgi:hypothetical protein